MLLKGKGPGGMAPPFLLGVDSDDESKVNIDKTVNSVPIPMSVDSDDGKIIFIAILNLFFSVDIFSQIGRAFR